MTETATSRRRKSMQQMRSEDHEHIQGVWARLGTLEKSYAATEANIQALSTGLADIRVVLTRMEDRNKPNIQGMFIALLATCTFLITVGGLTLAPLYRDHGRTYESLVELSTQQNSMRTNRFTSTDGQHLEEALRQVDTENTVLIYENRQRLAKIEGLLENNPNRD